MTHKNFNWDPDTWTKDYRAAFETLKEAIQESMTLHFPDYDLEWIMRTDASILAVAAVLFQVVNNPDGTKSYQLIGCASKKFSQQAYSWDIHKKEAYAMYYGYQTFAYYLRGKEFTAQIDHINLTYIENNQTPIVVRWRIFMQSFQSKVTNGTCRSHEPYVFGRHRRDCEGSN